MAMPSTPLCLALSLAMLGLVFHPVPSALAHDEALYNSQEYNNGQLGQYVTQTFVSTYVTAPKVNFAKSFTNPACDDGSYLFIAPRGEKAKSSVCILDASGSLVWTTDDYEGQAYNLQVQEYKSKKYLTFWAGNNSIGGHGVGKYYMVGITKDQAYHDTSILRL
jgi:hypothetical protein